MSEPAQDLEGRLAEIDRRLREIQAELVPGRVPRETRLPIPEPLPRARRRTDHRPQLAVTGTAPSAGRSGPLADALQRAREGRARDAPPDHGAPNPSNAGFASEVQASLLAAMRDLLDGYEQIVRGTREAADPSLRLTAGPFSGTAALRAFERALGGLPGVREVTLIGFEGRDHAILEVRLGPE